MERFDESINCYKLAIKANPEYINAYKNYGTLLMDSKRYEVALDVFDRALEYNSKNADLYTNRGVTL